MSDHHIVPVRTYLYVFAALMVLLVLTVAVAYIDFGHFAPLVAMIVATAKAVLVILYFMHVRYSSQLTWVFAVVGFVFLFILLLLMLSDYASRPWLGSPL